MRPTVQKLATAAGILGPAAFLTALGVSERRQDGYSIRDEHISGLAAPDARNPELVLSGFLTMGISTIAFSTALRSRLGGGRHAGFGPWLLALTGLGAIGAGLMRRDRMLLHPPDQPDDYVQSWKNDGHDISAGVIYATSVAAPLFLFRHLQKDEALARMAPIGIATSVASLTLMAAFSTQVDRHGNGLVQRVMVGLPMGYMSALAWRMLRGS